MGFKFCSPILGIAVYHHVDYFDGTKVPACQTLANTFWSALYFLSSIFLFFIVPFLILIVLYLIIAKNLISNAATIVLNKHLDSYSIRARKQVILMLGTVVLSFFLCLIPFRVFILWIIIAPEEKVYQLGVEKYYNILYFCRIMVYLNSAINPILYNLMSSKFRTGFVICSENRRRLHFKRSRNGTFSTTATSCRSSTLRNSNDGYRVYFRQRNNSIVLKNLNESPDSNRSNDSGNANDNSPQLFRANCRKDNLHNNASCIDEVNETDDYDSSNGKTSSIYDNYPTISLNRGRCYSVTEEVINLHEKFVKDLNKNDEESFV